MEKPTTTEERGAALVRLTELIDRTNSSIDYHQTFDEPDQLALGEYRELRARYIHELNNILQDLRLEGEIKVRETIDKSKKLSVSSGVKDSKSNRIPPAAIRKGKRDYKKMLEVLQSSIANSKTVRIGNKIFNILPADSIPNESYNELSQSDLLINQRRQKQSSTYRKPSSARKNQRGRGRHT